MDSEKCHLSLAIPILLLVVLEVPITLAILSKMLSHDFRNVDEEPSPYKLLIEKSKKIRIFEALPFSKTHCYCQSQEILFKQHPQKVFFQGILHRQIQYF